MNSENKFNTKRGNRKCTIAPLSALRSIKIAGSPAGFTRGTLRFMERPLVVYAINSPFRAAVPVLPVPVP